MKLDILLRRCAAVGCVILAVSGISLAAPVGITPATAAAPALIASTTQLTFREVTLGTYVGPLDVTLTNQSASSDTIRGYLFSGDNDFLFDNPQSKCSSTLAPGASCTMEFDFNPGALGQRNETVSVDDTANSGVTISMTGTGRVGYYQVSAQGAVGYNGDAAFYGDLAHTALNKPIVGIAPTGDDGGYWLVASDGGVFNYGDAAFDGSAGSIPLNKPIVGIAPDDLRGPDGYLLVASDGGIFSYGGAQFYGSTGGITLNKPIVGIAVPRHGDGYWMVASDGGIFAYGAAQFFGSTGAIHLNKPIVGMAPTPDDGGYWLVASDGGIFSFGDAGFYGSAGSLALHAPIVGMAPMPDGNGYWFSAGDGGLFNYGDAPFYGTTSGLGLVLGMASDGAPTVQAALHWPAIRRPRTAGSTEVLASGTPRFAGP
jgi:hypothetical protein